jgi:hypothetical protein
MCDLLKICYFFIFQGLFFKFLFCFNFKLNLWSCKKHKRTPVMVSALNINKHETMEKEQYFWIIFL